MGETFEVVVEGVTLIASRRSVYDTDISPGDCYIAKRNTGWKLLTCREVAYGANRCTASSLYCEHAPDRGHPSYIYPVELAYVYDSWESYKVLDVK